MTIGEKLEASKNGLDALLTYANGVTGASDSSIGDAVKTLADGFGHGGLSPILQVELNETMTVKQIWDDIYPEKDSQVLVLMTTGRDIDPVGNCAYVLGHYINSAGTHSYLGLRSRGGTVTSFSWSPATEDYVVHAGRTLTFYKF